MPALDASQTTDDIVYREETTIIVPRAPRAAYVLDPGQLYISGPMNDHHFHGQNNFPRRNLLGQGVGVFDWMPIGS